MFVLNTLPESISVAKTPGWLERNWWRVSDNTIDCSPDQMDEVSANHFVINIDNLPSDANRAPPLSGMVSGYFVSFVFVFVFVFFYFGVELK